jgi:RNase P/RNase MRP subunit POP5
MRQYDVLTAADHFVMVTTVIMDEALDKRDIENAAWKRLADEYGDEWVETTKSFIKQVSIEEPAIPEAGDPADAGIDGA